MERGDAWSAGPVGGADTGREELLRVAERAARAARGLTDGQVVTAAVVCELCGSGDFDSAEFEVWDGECYCVGCLLPIGVRDGDVLTRTFQRPDAPPWTLAPTKTPGMPARPAEYFKCPQGHGVFQVAVALVLDGDASVRTISVGLRCPEDGGLHLFIDNEQVMSTRA